MKRKTTKSIPATPEQIAMYGGVATALRSYMDTNKLNVRQLSVQVGLPETAVSLYAYVNSKKAPGAAMRAKISQATGIPQADLLPRSLAPGATTRLPALPMGRPPAMPMPAKPREVLGFTVDATGMATLTLHATLPLDAATPLLRMLLDAGLVFTKPEGN